MSTDTEMQTVQIRCGNCKGTHPTVAAVRACFSLASTPAPKVFGILPNPAPSTDTRSASQKQLDYIQSLRASRGVTGGAADGPLTMAQASEIIQTLKASPKPSRPVAGTYQTIPTSAEVPSGRYALHPNGHWLFLKVWRADDERIARVWTIAGDEEIPNNPFRTAELLHLIKARGAVQASEDWGKEIGSCGICGRQLTNAVSLERGIGPVCAGRYGW